MIHMLPLSHATTQHYTRRIYYFTRVAVYAGSADVTGGTRYLVERFIQHPNKTDLTRSDSAVRYISTFNDIALIKLATPIVFDDVTVMPVCLGEGHHGDRSFQRCYVAGWGSVHPESRKSW